MAVYVRELSRQEGNRVMQLARNGKSPIAVRRAQVVLASAQGMKAPAIAGLYHLSADYVRKIIHRFNGEGFSTLGPGYSNGGRPAKFTAEERSMIVEVASTPPKILGLPFTHWSLHKLKQFLIDQKIVDSISHEQVRRTLKRAGWSLQRTKTWKESNDPQFEVKKNVSSGSTRRLPQGEG